MDNNENYQKIILDCAVCKTKFELWIDMTRGFTPEFADYLRENFSSFCPVCKAFEELRNQQE